MQQPLRLALAQRRRGVFLHPGRLDRLDVPRPVPVDKGLFAELPIGPPQHGERPGDGSRGLPRLLHRLFVESEVIPGHVERANPLLGQVVDELGQVSPIGPAAVRADEPVADPWHQGRGRLVAPRSPQEGRQESGDPPLGGEVGRYGRRLAGRRELRKRCAGLWDEVRCGVEHHPGIDGGQLSGGVFAGCHGLGLGGKVVPIKHIIGITREASTAGLAQGWLRLDGRAGRSFGHRSTHAEKGPTEARTFLSGSPSPSRSHHAAHSARRVDEWSVPGDQQFRHPASDTVRRRGNPLQVPL